MSELTIGQLTQQLTKAENNLRRARDRDGKPGRGGAIVDMTDIIAREERRVSEWRALLAFAENGA